MAPLGDALAQARRVVIKIGSSLLIDPATGAPNATWLASVAQDVASLRAAGVQALVVASGAVALGRAALSIAGPLRLDQKQAAAAAGQARLMRAFEEAFAGHHIPVGQALLTPDITEERRRWLNARATLNTLLAFGALPVINENDTVATQELRYGDNDRLAARVAQMVGADALLLLSDVEGLFAADPTQTPDAAHIPLVATVTPEIEAMAGGVRSATGSGGMRTKIAAAKIAAAAGCATAVFSGREPAPITRLRNGARATWFAPSGTPKQAYKAWIAGALSPRGALRLDAGAAAAVKAGKSVLPAGVTSVEGAFEKGDAVRILDDTGREIARAIVRYDATDATQILGLKSSMIEDRLGYSAGPALAHADDVAVGPG